MVDDVAAQTSADKAEEAVLSGRVIFDNVVTALEEHYERGGRSLSERQEFGKFLLDNGFLISDSVLWSTLRREQLNIEADWANGKR